MTNIIKTTLLSLTLVLGLSAVVPATASAALFDNSKEAACKGVGSNCAGGETEINDAVGNIIDLLSLVVGIAAVVMIIIGGFRYITSAGDSNGVNSAKHTILYALVGLIIVVMAQVIVRFVLSNV